MTSVRTVLAPPRPQGPGRPSDKDDRGDSAPGGVGRLRVAQVLVGFRVDGGAERVVRTLLGEARRLPLEASVIVLKPPKAGNRNELRDLGCGLIDLPARRLVDPIRFLKLLRALRRGRFDVVHTHLTSANILGVVAARILGIPSVVTLHSTHSEADGHWYHGRLERFVLRHVAGTILAVGHETALAQSSRIGRSDIVVLSNAVAPSEPIDAAARCALRREIMSDPSRRLILTVGRIEPPKAHDDLVEAFAELVAGGVDAELVIVGRGSLHSATEALATQHGVADRVHFPGVRGDVPALMQVADLFALSSHWEGLPMVLLEAMECRLPIVSTDVGDVASLLDGTPSRIVPPGRPQELAAALAATLADLDAHRDLTTAGAQIVRTRYSSSAWADQLLHQYTRVTTPGSSASG
jgi:glycosyltransferase involved in cell wall biosynthesis